MQPNYIVFDIETAPLDAATILSNAEPFDPDSVKLGNRKDPNVIAQYKQECREKYDQDLIERAALNATTGRVLCAGLYYSAEDRYTILAGDEKELLTKFWTLLVYPEKYVGFNILGFDLPFICRRCWHLGIQVPAWVFDGRYFSRHFTDLMEFWRLGNRQDTISLDKFARFVGLSGKKISGKEFAMLYKNNQDEAIEYLKNDLRLTAQIANRIQP